MSVGAVVFLDFDSFVSSLSDSFSGNCCFLVVFVFTFLVGADCFEICGNLFRIGPNVGKMGNDNGFVRQRGTVVGNGGFVGFGLVYDSKIEDFRFAFCISRYFCAVFGAVAVLFVRDRGNF